MRDEKEDEKRNCLKLEFLMQTRIHVCAFTCNARALANLQSIDNKDEGAQATRLSGVSQRETLPKRV